MKVRKSEFTGTSKVFAFSIQQYFKSPATIVLLVMMLLGSSGGVLLMFFSMGKGEVADQDASTLYIRNESPYTLSVANMPEHVDAQLVEGDTESWLQRLDEGETGAVLVSVEMDEARGWLCQAYTGKDSKVGSREASRLAEACADALQEARYLAAGVSEEQVREAMAGYRVDTATVREFTEPKSSEEEEDARFALDFVYSLIIFMLIVFSTTFIVKAVIEEKSSKLVELLMVSVKPLALIAGKILAAMCLVLASLAVMALGLFGSRFILGMVSGGEGMLQMGEQALGAIVTGLNASSVLIVLVSLLLGYFTFSILGGISGTCCSSLEESDSAVTTVMMLAMLGYFVGIFTSFFDSRAVAAVFSLLPVLSVFVAPSRYLTGQIDLWVLLLSWVIQAGVVLFLARFCARIYGALLIYKGEKLRIKHLLRMSREAKGGVRA